MINLIESTPKSKGIDFWKGRFGFNYVVLHYVILHKINIVINFET